MGSAEKKGWEGEGGRERRWARRDCWDEGMERGEEREVLLGERGGDGGRWFCSRSWVVRGVGGMEVEEEEEVRDGGRVEEGEEVKEVLAREQNDMLTSPSAPH